MARLSRFFVEGETLHVIQRGNNRRPVFVLYEDYCCYLAWLRHAAERHGLVLHAYVLMTNHVHLLATPANAASLPGTMQSLGRRYVRYFNDRHNRSGTLWEGRYRATIIDSERYFLTCMRYIELNPVRAGMVGHPAQYPWSSHRANRLGLPDATLVAHEIYRRLGRSEEERRSAYGDLFGVPLHAEEVASIRETTNKAWVLGDDHFRARIEAQADRRAGPLRRPRAPRSPSSASAQRVRPLARQTLRV